MISSLVSGGSGIASSLINGIFGWSNNKRTNENNMKIAQMNNEFNAQEALKNREFITAERNDQNAWNREQWNLENEYNSAASQRSRLEEAGLNPYLMLSGGNAGTASSVSGSTGAVPGNPSADPVRQIPYQPNFDFSGVANAINSYYDNRKKAAETEGIGLNNQLVSQFGEDKFLADIASSIDGNFEYLSPVYRRLRSVEAPNLAGIDIDTKRNRLESLRIHQELELAQGSLAYINANTQRILNKYLPQQQQADLWIKASQIYRNYADGMLSKEKLHTEITQQVLNSAIARGHHISNKLAASTASGVIQAINQENAYNRDYYRFLRRHVKNIVENDVDISHSNALLSEHNERVMRANRQWRHVDKTADIIGRLLGAGLSGAKINALMKTSKGRISGSGSDLFPWID